MNKQKTLIIILVIILMTSTITGCSPLISDANPDDDTPLFPGDTSEVQAKEYMLYFQLEGEGYLAPEIRTMTIPGSKSVEETLIRALISGPEGNASNITANINENTRLLSVTGDEDVLFVSLSDDFLNPPEGLGQHIEDPFVYESLVLTTRKMALYSIVNTITELGIYSSVQFYIDKYDNGTGTRLTKKEMGFLGEDEDQLIEPLYRNTDAIFSPASSAEIIMNSISEKNWTKVLEYTSLAEKPNEDAENLIRQLELNDLSLLEYRILSSSVSLNGKNAVVILSYSFSSADGTADTKENISVKMILDDGIWKCSVISINKILLGEYE